MPTLHTPTATVSYDESGDPDGLPVVMFASGAHDHHDFDALRALLPARLRTIAVDWPGHGESPAPGGEMSAMAFADIAEAVVERLAPAGAIVMGSSVGGFSATRLAVRRPELVRGLVIADGGGFSGRPPHVRLFCALMARPRFLRAIYPAFAARYMRARTDADRTALAASVATTRSDPGLSVVSAVWKSFASPEHDLRAAAPSISAPTLLVWGRRDPVLALRFGKRAQRLIRGSRLVVVDSGHLPHTSHPETVAAELVTFAAGVAAGSGPVADTAPAAAA